MLQLWLLLLLLSLLWQYFDINVDDNFLDDITNGSPSLKNGVKLPTSTNDWDIANTYFHSNIPISEISEKDIDEIVKHLNWNVYNYFKDNFGLVDSSKEENKRKNKRKKERNPPVSRLRFVSRMLHTKATSSTTGKVYSTDHDLESKNNFWKYVRHYLEKATKVLSSFDKVTCCEFFKKSFKCVNPTKKFRIPSWIPSFLPHEKPFDSNPLTYAEISQIIKEWKQVGHHVHYRGGFGGEGAARPPLPPFFFQSLVFFANTLKNYKLCYSKLNWSLIMHHYH